MPLYDCQCVKCGFVPDVMAKIDELPICPTCGLPMERLISAAFIRPDFEPYMHENLGPVPVPIKSRQDLHEQIARRGLCDYEGKNYRPRWI